MCTHRAQNAALKNLVEQLMRDKEALKMQHLQSGTAACDFPLSSTHQPQLFAVVVIC